MGINTNLNGSTRKGLYRVWMFLTKNPQIMDLNELPWESNQFGIPKDTVRIIRENFQVYTTKIVGREDSKRGDTTKLLVELQDGHRIETVIMRHKGRSTACVSSQIGCAMGCKFCATGTLGIIGDLSAGEILEQLVHANSISKVRNVVFMGMGEPLNNWKNVKLAVQAMVDPARWSLSPRRVTVSTVGVTNAMRALTDELEHVNIALSLHAPNQEVRKKIVPSAAGNKLEDLMEALDYHIARNKGSSNEEEIDVVRNLRDGNLDGIGEECHKAPNEKKKGIIPACGEKTALDAGVTTATQISTGPPLISVNGIFNFRVDVKAGRSGFEWRNTGDHMVMIEYILIKDINDRAEHARELVQLLGPRRKHLLLNLIPYNPTVVAEEFEASEAQSIQNFFEICAEGGLFTRVRQEMGQDISGACGQLALVKLKEKDKVMQQERDIEDLAGPAHDVIVDERKVNKGPWAKAFRMKVNKAPWATLSTWIPKWTWLPWSSHGAR
eukprot:gnl/MRDRNA2_/MRDRNA2_15723_c0_seq1.p1 gnl/MRDRNA2_/MRDRNA2_15723_c0~~gnl/MRDRNA2_/MRDRNA2_15723_c0_seq1.p1  ORF type:complete len:497 (+),score=88.45 gnl/MRDRNA2_/MRDRNA2_15723_c0_seq1:161-1651(+)